MSFIIRKINRFLFVDTIISELIRTNKIRKNAKTNLFEISTNDNTDWLILIGMK
jgi:hypothetical protein